MDNSSPPAPISPKSPISLNLAFLTITLVSLLLSIFFIYQNWRLTQKLEALIKNTQPTPTPLLSPTPSVDVNSTWKTYSHPTLGYSFSYPQDASIEAYDNSITVRIDPPDPRTIVGVCPRWISFSAPTASSSTKKTQDKYGCIHNALVLEEKVLVESQYREKNQGVIDQILSTFTFLDQNVAQ